MTPALVMLGIGVVWTIAIIITVVVFKAEPSIPSCVIVGLGYGLGLPGLWLWKGSHNNDDTAIRVAGVAAYILTIGISGIVAYLTAA